MKIYSWNILFNNRELDRAFEFISQTDFDIFCLQEVPEAFLERLISLPFHIAHTTESDMLFRGNRSTISSVILSKHPIVHSDAILLKQQVLGLRRRCIASIMYALHIWAEGVGDRRALYADIETPDHGTVRVFNLHLPLMHPRVRVEEFELAMTERDTTRPTIVCGDFNILEALHITPINWLFGGRVSDAMRYSRERAHIEKRFAEHELHNALSGKITHPFSRSQLDHILVSKSFSIKNAEVLPDRGGSDHHPILVEVT